MSGGESGPNNARESMAPVRGPLTRGEGDSRDCHGKAFLFFLFCPGILVEINLRELYFSSQIFVEICVGCFAIFNMYFFDKRFSFKKKMFYLKNIFLGIFFYFFFKHIFYFKQLLEII